MRYLILIVLGVFLLACNDKLDIFQKYKFVLETMPVPIKIQMDETIEIRCKIVKEGYFDKTKFHIRYFQPDGKGILKLNGLIFTPNDLYPLNNDLFRLYYTSQCTDQQKIDLYIEDNFGQIYQKSFSFTNYSEEKNE